MTNSLHSNLQLGLILLYNNDCIPVILHVMLEQNLDTPIQVSSRLHFMNDQNALRTFIMQTVGQL